MVQGNGLEKDVNQEVYTILNLVHMCLVLQLHLLNLYIIVWTSSLVKIKKNGTWT